MEHRSRARFNASSILKRVHPIGTTRIQRRTYVLGYFSSQSSTSLSAHGRGRREQKRDRRQQYAAVSPVCSISSKEKKGGLGKACWSSWPLARRRSVRVRNRSRDRGRGLCQASEGMSWLRSTRNRVQSLKRCHDVDGHSMSRWERIKWNLSGTLCILEKRWSSV